MVAGIVVKEGMRNHFHVLHLDAPLAAVDAADANPAGRWGSVGVVAMRGRNDNVVVNDGPSAIGAFPLDKVGMGSLGHGAPSDNARGDEVAPIMVLVMLLLLLLLVMS